MLDEIAKVEAQARTELAAQDLSLDAIEDLRIRYLGRKGILAGLTKHLKTCAPEDRPAVGKAINALKQFCKGALNALKQHALDNTASAGPVQDPTLPGKPPPTGTLHPITQTIREFRRICRNLGFDVAWGPEAETCWYNFDALNIPASHPDRDETDTLYISDDVLLRTQTSTVQIRVMEKTTPPIRIIAPGRVFRNDTDDASHYHMFNQVEGLWVDEGITMAHLKSMLLKIFRALFNSKVKLRFWPSFFPFTEPSAEIHMSCTICQGKGCAVCSQTGWLEMGGCGMVDPNVFKAVGIDAEKYTGLAFGMGVDRLTMFRRKIKDIRLLFENDVRFLRQFR